MPDAKLFTVLDARQAFYHITLKEKSSYVTTFATPFGRYRYLRLPMGISSASEVYQQAMDVTVGREVLTWPASKDEDL